MLLSAMGAQFLWVLLGSVWMDSSITAWRRGTGAFIHWLSHHWLRVAPRVAHFPALSSCAAAQTDEALQGFCLVWVIQKTHLCVAQVATCQAQSWLRSEVRQASVSTYVSSTALTTLFCISILHWSVTILRTGCVTTGSSARHCVC